LINDGSASSSLVDGRKIRKSSGQVKKISFLEKLASTFLMIMLAKEVRLI